MQLAMQMSAPPSLPASKVKLSCDVSKTRYSGHFREGEDHGDYGAECADIILPGATYAEQDGYFTNLEGKVQKAFKASYPPGEAKEDWQIINELAEIMNNRKLFNDKDELESSMFNYLNLQKEKQVNDQNNSSKEFQNENLTIKVKDYYFSNVIARSSKTMVECNNSKLNLKSTGTEG